MQRFKNILFFADGSEEITPALQRAVQLAESNQASLTVVDVIEPVKHPLNSPRGLISISVSCSKSTLNRYWKHLVSRWKQTDSVIYTRVLSGIPFAEVIKFVQSGDFDLLIKMARPPAGISEKLFGSVDLHLLRKCACPVLFDRPCSAARYQRVLAEVLPILQKRRAATI